MSFERSLAPGSSVALSEAGRLSNVVQPSLDVDGAEHCCTQGAVQSAALSEC